MGSGAAELEGGFGGDGLDIGNASHAIGAKKFSRIVTHFDGDFFCGF
jgi:hypothetical protein